MLRDELVENAHKHVDVCQCERCQVHMTVVALNQLPAFYITGTSGKVYGEYLSKSSQTFSDIVAAIEKAITQISANPPHP